MHHIGIAVKDIETAVDFFSLLGIKFTQIRLFSAKEAYLHGELVSYTLRITVALLTPDVKLELVSPVEGKSIHNEFIKQFGGCVSHIAYEVHDLKDAIQSFKRSGFSLALNPFGKNTNVVYMDTREVVGIYTELIQKGTWMLE